MNALSLSKSTPSNGKGNRERACLIAMITLPLSRVRTGMHSVQPARADLCATIDNTLIPRMGKRSDARRKGPRNLAYHEAHISQHLTDNDIGCTTAFQDASEASVNDSESGP